jgi:hypothetical protein
MNSARSHWFDLAAKLLAVSSAVYFFSYVSADPDLWGHIKFGAELWKEKALPAMDPYSFTAYGHPWINHEWLTELIFYFTYRTLGDAGLLLGKLGIGLLIVALLWKMCNLRKGHPLVFGAVMVLAIAVVSPGFMIRPQVFSFFFFTLFLYILHRYLQKGENRLFLLPFVMVLWVNMHGGFLMGGVLLTTVAGWETLARLIRRKDHVEPGTLWLWLLVTGGAALLNPYGYKLLVFLYKSLSVHRDISEWKPVCLWNGSFLHLKLLMLLFLASLWRKPKTWEGWEVAGCAVMLAATLVQQRHMPFFGIMVAPLLVCRLTGSVSNIHTRYPKLRLTRTSRHLIGICLSILIVVQIYHGTCRYVMTQCRIIVDPGTYPVSAVEFLKINRLEGNLLLPFDWGEYAIWKLYPGCRVSIDGRFRTVYPESVIQDHFIASHDSSRWRVLIEKYPADLLLVRQIPFFQSLINADTPWVYVYSDPTAIVFLRNSEKNQEALARFRAGQRQQPTTRPSPYFP